MTLYEHDTFCSFISQSINYMTTQLIITKCFMCYYILALFFLLAWLIFVQAVMSLGLIFSLLSLSFISVVLMRFLIKFEVFIIGAACILETIAGK